MPFALDVCGLIEREGAYLLKRFATQYSLRTAVPYTYALSLARRRVSTALHIGIARQLLLRVGDDNCSHASPVAWP